MGKVKIVVSDLHMGAGRAAGFPAGLPGDLSLDFAGLAGF